jgi:hypothetical protein
MATTMVTYTTMAMIIGMRELKKPWYKIVNKTSCYS